MGAFSQHELTDSCSTAPSTAWLVCAACGPLHESLVRQVGMELRDEPGVRYERRYYAVTEPSPFLRLRQWVEADTRVQEAMRRAEQIRRRGDVKNTCPLAHEDMIGSARAALLMGQGKLFLQRYRQYVQVRPFEWHPDPEHILFWDRLLGPGWEGTDAVPKGVARDEVLLLSANAFAFSPPPRGGASGGGICGAPAGWRLLEIAAAMRAAKPCELAHAEDEAAQAAALLMAGRFAEAQRRFERVFAASEDSRYALLGQQAFSLLIYALVGAVFAAGKLRFLRAWLACARCMLHHVYPPSMAAEQEEMVLFLEHLEQVDAILNRKGTLDSPPRFHGALSALPYAMTYGALPLSVQQVLDADTLAAAVEELAQAGLCMLAQYGAAGLRRQETLQPHGRQIIESLLEGVEESSLYPLPAPSQQVTAVAGHAGVLYHARGGIQFQVGEGAGSWFELGGSLSVDEERVLELSDLLEAYARREGDGLLSLGDGACVQMNPLLERQLALLELVCRKKQGSYGVAAPAIPLLEALENPATCLESPIEHTDPPAALRATLRPYQAEGYRWLVERFERGLGALLADDMGVGKTVQVLALLLHAAAQSDAGAALVVAPVSLLGNWAEEAARFAPSLKVITYDPRQAEPLAGAGAGTLVLASYGQVAARLADFSSPARRWDVLVLDEAQAIKNPDSQRTKAACTLSARARICLTGTPVENSLLDVWSQMRFLNPGLFGTRVNFLRRYRTASPESLALLRQVLAPLVLRRTKAEVLAQLPPLTETVEWVDFTREERALYESLRRSALRKLGQEEGGVGILAELTRLRRACCHGKLVLPAFAGGSSKLAAMTEMVKELRSAGRQVLVFSQFVDVLDFAQDALRAKDISFLRLDGSTPSRQRSALVKRFQQGEADVFLISLRAGGTGLNLTAADYVILLDPWWNPAVENQAAGRSHRMGQGHPVTLCRFMVRDSVEERILALHREKRELAESIMGGRGDGLSLDTLRELLGQELRR